MNYLEKYAAKKSLIKNLQEAIALKLYGKKPGAHTGLLSGATTGGVLGAPLGGALGFPLGIDRALRRSGARSRARMDRLSREGKPIQSIGEALFNGLIGAPTMAIAGGIDGALKGAGIGGGSGALAGGLLGRSLDKARLAKYLKHRKKINQRLALAGGGGAGLAGLAALSNRS